jgi:hypothetical protein
MLKSFLIATVILGALALLAGYAAGRFTRVRARALATNPGVLFFIASWRGGPWRSGVGNGRRRATTIQPSVSPCW